MHTILVVDDDPDIRDIIEVTLEDAGYTVVTASDGTAALTAFQSHAPSLVVLDVEMPGMSGIEVCRKIREFSEAPILFLSARAEDEDRIAGLEEGADDYVTKPFNAKELQIRIKGMLRRAGVRPALAPSQYTHYCAACIACVEDPNAACRECRSDPPEEGWPPIATSEYEYLGKVIDGRYLLDKFLGAGAMGVVYRVWGMAIGRHFACKIVDSSRHSDREFGEEVLRRFQTEVETMSRLRNPHVVTIYETMQLRENVFALVMDFVDGKTLQELLRVVGKMKVRAAIELARQIANGLFEAHGAGIIHRDLKPANIMVERLPATGFFARVLDFGIVHMVGNAASTDGFRGTPLYASPEQCLGESSLDNRSDIYSLGCVLFECITGGPPFVGRVPLKVMEAHVRSRPPLLSEALDGTVPVALEELMSAMLEKNPDDRPPDLQAVIERFADVLRELDDSRAAPPSALEMTLPIAPELPVARTGRLAEASAKLPDVREKSAESQLLFPLLGYSLPARTGTETAPLEFVSLDDAGHSVAIWESGVGVHLVDLKNVGRYRAVGVDASPVVAIDHVSDRGILVTAHEDGRIWRRDAKSSSEPVRLGKWGGGVACVTVSSDGQTVFAGTEDGRVVAVPSDGSVVRTLAVGLAPVRAIAHAARENALVVGVEGGKMFSITLGNNQRLKLEDFGEDARSVVMSADGYLVAILGASSSVRIFTLVGARTLFTMHTGDVPILDIAFAEDGRLIGIGLRERSIDLWELRCRPGSGTTT